MNKTFNGNKYYKHNNNYWVRTTQTYLSHDVWNYNYPNDPILENEVLHHKNGDRSDDRIENLEKMTREEHSRLHAIGENNSQYKGGMKHKTIYLGFGTVKERLYYQIPCNINSLGEVGSSYFDFYNK